MCGLLRLQKVLSGALSSRNFLVRPPEPSPALLLSSPSESVFVGRTQFLGVPFFWNPKKLLNPHLCVVGITGSGKSYFVKTFITRASLVMGTSALILDWAGEYSDWVRLAGGRVLSFGSEGINLLDLAGAAPHVRMRQVVDSLCMLTDLASHPQQLSLTEEAMEAAYRLHGFFPEAPPAGSGAASSAVGKARSHLSARHRKTARRRGLPTLRDVQAVLARMARGGGAIGQQSAQAERRIRNLLLSSGGSFCSSTFRLDSLLSGLVCVDLHSLPTEALRSLAGLAILQFVKERMRLQSYSEGAPRLFIVVDEAWKIAGDERSDVVSIVREGRKYGFSLIVASQNPTDVHKSIFSSAGTVMAFRLTHASEREYLRASLSYSGLFEELSHFLSVGQALVHLEFSSPAACPRDFILSRVEGEALLEVFRIRGDGLELEFERGELLRQLLSFGLSERQAQSVLSEFERSSHSLPASQFVALLEKSGHGRASTVAFLRRLGAGEKELLPLFSAMSRPHPARSQAAVYLRDDEGRKPAR